MRCLCCAADSLRRFVCCVCVLGAAPASRGCTVDAAGCESGRSVDVQQTTVLRRKGREEATQVTLRVLVKGAKRMKGVAAV